MNKYEMHQGHCRFCFLRLEFRSLEELLVKIEEHEAKCEKRKNK